MKLNFIKIVLVKSIIGRLPKHRSTIIGLGLKKINDFVILKRTDIVLGMVKKVDYLVKIELL